MISGYNGEAPPVRNLALIFAKELKLFGFIVASLDSKYTEEFYRVVPAKIASGEIRYTEDVTKGLQFAGHAIVDVQKGRNKGKSVIVVAEA